ncbi:hypothetical protein LDENG_00190030 [Lucifuga dentata]|nr:hypothetical protein LDENG_00190030 [Lucifuga dentata]
MKMVHYINSSAQERRSAAVKRKRERNTGGSNVYRLVGVSFGLLCILQSALNISLRLYSTGCHNNSNHDLSSTPTSLYDITALIKERDQQAQKINGLKALSGDLQDKQMALTKVIDRLKRQIILKNNQITDLQEENKRLLSNISELVLSCSEAEIKAQRCPFGWKQFMSSCYLLSSTRNTWWHARQDCVQKGAHLVVLNCQNELEALNGLHSCASMWIGMSYQSLYGNRKWAWVDQSQLTYSNWDYQDLPYPVGNGNKNCVFAQQTVLTWFPALCSELHYWVCEKELK